MSQSGSAKRRMWTSSRSSTASAHTCTSWLCSRRCSPARALAGKVCLPPLRNSRGWQVCGPQTLLQEAHRLRTRAINALKVPVKVFRHTVILDVNTLRVCRSGGSAAGCRRERRQSSRLRQRRLPGPSLSRPARAWGSTRATMATCTVTVCAWTTYEHRLVLSPHTKFTPATFSPHLPHRVQACDVGVVPLFVQAASAVK